MNWVNPIIIYLFHTKMIKNKAFQIWSYIVALLSLNVLILNILILTTEDHVKVQFIPDDAFYYLSLARNFVSLRQWTFDSGISLTSGFHILFAYILAFIYFIFKPSESGFINYGILVSFLFSVVGIFIAFMWGMKYRNLFFLMFYALIISSRNFAYNSFSITEWSLLVLISLVYIFYFFTRFSTYTKIDLRILFIVGLLGSLARSDFGILPFSILLSSCLSQLITKYKKLAISLPLAGFIGAGIGLFLVFAHNYLFTHQFLQSSAVMKAHWAQFIGPNYQATAFLIRDIIGLPGMLLLISLLATSIIVQSIRQRRKLQTSFTMNPTSISMLIAAGICIISYSLFYSRNGDIQSWYTGILISPSLIAVFALSEYFSFSINKSFQKIPISLLFIGVISWNLLGIYPIQADNAPWPHQTYLFEAGQYLKHNRLDGKIGAWNAGIINYFEGGHVLNLDGLVNNDVYAYILNNDTNFAL